MWWDTSAPEREAGSGRGTERQRPPPQASHRLSSGGYGETRPREDRSPGIRPQAKAPLRTKRTESVRVCCQETLTRRASEGWTPAWPQEEGL